MFIDELNKSFFTTSLSREDSPSSGNTDSLAVNKEDYPDNFPGCERLIT